MRSASASCARGRSRAAASVVSHPVAHRRAVRRADARHGRNARRPREPRRRRHDPAQRRVADHRPRRPSTHIDDPAGRSAPRRRAGRNDDDRTALRHDWRRGRAVDGSLRRGDATQTPATDTPRTTTPDRGSIDRNRGNNDSGLRRGDAPSGDATPKPAPGTDNWRGRAVGRHDDTSASPAPSGRLGQPRRAAPHHRRHRRRAHLPRRDAVRRLGHAPRVRLARLRPQQRALHASAARRTFFASAVAFGAVARRALVASAAVARQRIARVASRQRRRQVEEGLGLGGGMWGVGRVGV